MANAELNLREYMEARLEALEGRMDLHVTYTRDALGLAKAIADKRMEEANRVRDQLREQTQHFVAREPYEVAHLNIDKRVSVIETATANIQGRIWAMGVGLAVFFTAIEIVLRFLTSK